MTLARDSISDTYIIKSMPSVAGKGQYYIDSGFGIRFSNPRFSVIPQTFISLIFFGLVSDISSSQAHV